MFRTALFFVPIFLIMASCSSLKQASEKTFAVERTSNSTNAEQERPIKFLDDIEIGVEAAKVDQQKAATVVKSTKDPVSFASESDAVNAEASANALLQSKFSELLQTEKREITNFKLYSFIDEWYGTRYRLGGNSKNGIDCSAFTQLFFATIFDFELPRTAREQYQKVKKISRTEIRQGDLIFFNTTGGVSHVGVYLQNNKFVHASASSGVTVSDLYDPYWLRRFIGVGRINTGSLASSL